MPLIVTYLPGARVIAGNTGQIGQEIAITDPWNNTAWVTSGDKLEHGIGGFEVLAPSPGKPYRIDVDNITPGLFEHKDGMTFITWVDSPEPGPPVEPPIEPPVPPIEPPVPIPPDCLCDEAFLQVVIDKLTTIERLIIEKCCE